MENGNKEEAAAKARNIYLLVHDASKPSELDFMQRSEMLDLTARMND